MISRSLSWGDEDSLTHLQQGFSSNQTFLNVLPQKFRVCPLTLVLPMCFQKQGVFHAKVFRDRRDLPANDTVFEY